MDWRPLHLLGLDFIADWERMALIGRARNEKQGHAAGDPSLSALGMGGYEWKSWVEGGCYKTRTQAAFEDPRCSWESCRRSPGEVLKRI